MSKCSTLTARSRSCSARARPVLVDVPPGWLPRCSPLDCSVTSCVRAFSGHAVHPDMFADVRGSARNWLQTDIRLWVAPWVAGSCALKLLRYQLSMVEPRGVEPLTS